ncbi:MAG: metallophosphoesterase [Arachnia sp.]
MFSAYPSFDFDQVDYVTSDTHFSHARISELATRPFASVTEMDNELIRRWNQTVAPTDTILHLGDVALGPIADSLPLTAQLNGRKFLVPGNHDRVSPATQSRRAIERFSPLYKQAGWIILPEIIEGTRRGIRVLASHYPYSGDTQDADRLTSHRPVDRGIPLLHGHTHERVNGPAGHQFHVGVDAFEYAPISLSLIDAWLDDLVVSSAHHGLPPH